MHLHIPVFRAIAQFEMRVGAKPTALYLGRRENNWLEQWCAMFPRKACVNEVRARRQFSGLDVYSVDAEQHLAVA